MKLHFLKGFVMWYLHRPSRIRKYVKRNKKNEERIRNKETITVVFFASNLAMWHYQGLYEEMLKYSRFKPYIVLSPLTTFPKEQKIESVQKLRNFFQDRDVSYIDYDTDKMKGYDVKGKLEPDILFYPQPYYTVMERKHSYYSFKDSLLAYYPYYFHLNKNNYAYNEDFHNRAWRLYYESELQKKDAKKIASIGDINVRITGYPNADEFMKKPIDVWKPQILPKKRIIWAPHFTIGNDGWLHKTNFLWMADYMIEMNIKYKNKIQIAFKPHPRLMSELYKHPEWGKEKTDDYYMKWKNLENGQLEIGDFINLFMTSDAMIHDSSSFSAEYLYSGNPVMYVCDDISQILNSASEFGKMVYDAHYLGNDKKDIEDFICNCVIGGCDPFAEKRERIRYNYLLPPNNKTCAQNTMDDIINSL